MSPTRTHDVIIAGAGIAGSCFGMLLAKHGLSVLIIEIGKHPRFALGEALLPQSAIWPFMIGEAFGVREIQHLSSADRIVEHITPSCGIKHSISFAYHREGAPLDPAHLQQLIPPHLPFYSESHLMREQVDLYLLQAAQRYGCDYIDQTRIERVDTAPDQVTVATDRGSYVGRFYIDTSGKDSVLATQQGYRDGAADLQTHSRSIFAHVEGLRPFDEVLGADAPGQTRRLHDGTLHHVFDGGWMWVIPFDNFAKSSSRKVSVGFMLDTRKHPPRDGLTAEEEFYSFVRRFPSVAAHFQGVTTSRPFARTGRMQYAAARAVGERHFLTNNSYGFVDALYSNGLVQTFENLFYGAALLLSAFGKIDGPIPAGDFRPEGFARLDTLLATQLADADLLVSSAYKAMGASATWTAWTQVWLAQVLFHDLWLQRTCFQYFASQDPRTFMRFLDERRPGAAAPFAPAKSEMLVAVVGHLDRFVAGSQSAEEASEGMLAELRRQDWLPRHVYPWGDRAARHVDFARPDVVGQLLEWGFQSSPEHLRKGLFDFQLPPMS